MAASLGSFGLGLVVSLLVASACSGNTGSDGNGAAGKTSGGSASGAESSGGSVSRSGSASGGSASGGSASGGRASGGSASGGKASGGSVNGGGSANSGGDTSSGGAGDATAGGAGAAGDSKACQSVDDCVIASVFSNSGCCARTDCGGGYNRAWVLSEPCASANSSTDPVPASCSQGCLACPASQCPKPVGVLCISGQCQAVTPEGPCSSDADCVLALDYTTPYGDCCGCSEVVSKAYEEAVECVALDGAAKPAGCTSGGTCDSTGCVICTKPTPACKMGRCVEG